MWWPDSPKSSLSASDKMKSSVMQRVKTDQLSGFGVDEGDRSGPSGVNITEVENVRMKDNAKPENSHHNQNKHRNAENVKKFESNDDDTKPKEAVELFAERVTIMGLKEAYKAKIQGVRIMFRIALIFCSVMIVSKTKDIALHYKNQKAVFTDLELINYQAPFPNVSICISMYYLNYELVDQWVVPERWRDRMRKFNMSMTDIRQRVEDTMLWGFDDTQLFNSQIYLVTSAVFRAAAEDAKKNGKTIWEIFWPSCRETLSNCAFNGQPFDCCQAATLVPTMIVPCIQIKSNWMTINNNRDPMQRTDIGLTFDVSTNWAMGLSRHDPDDGYHIFVDELPDNFKVPVSVPAGMDVSLILKEPKKVEQKAECVPNENAPNLKYYSYYDTNGIQCQMEALIDVGSQYLGCMFPVLTYIPVNKSCLFEAWVISGMLLNGGAEALANLRPAQGPSIKGSAENAGSVAALETESYGSSSEIFSKNSPCKPLCSRWTYPVLSASYGSIQYRDKDLEKRRLTNRTWSRVRVILPQSSSSHKEEPRSSSYLAFCDVKGMMGIYAGFSVVTYVQILAYGIYVVWSFVRNRLRMRKIRNETRMSAVVIPSVRTTFLEQCYADKEAKRTTSSAAITSEPMASLAWFGFLDCGILRNRAVDYLRCTLLVIFVQRR